MSNIKTEIDANIHSNMATPITGGVLNGVLNDMVDDYDEKVGDIASKLGDFVPTETEITKEVTWNNGWINTSGVIGTSSASRFSQPILLKKGEKVKIGTQNTNITIIGKTTASSLAVGDTITPIKTTSAVAQYETYEYTALEDTKIVLCVLASNYTLKFYQLGNLTTRIDDLDKEINGGRELTYETSSGYFVGVIGGTSVTINTSSASKFTQPFKLYSGETLVYKSSNDYSACLVEFNAPLPELAVGSTYTNVLVVMNKVATTEFETLRYTADHDMYVGACGCGNDFSLSVEGDTSKGLKDVSVRVDESQSFSEDEKTQARNNIDALCVGDFSSSVITKDLTWSNGWIQFNGTVTTSSASKYTQPFTLKKGEKVKVGTQNTNITIIGTTTASSLSIGDIITPIQYTSSVAQFETYEYTAAEDIKIVLCVRASEYSVEFTKSAKVDISALSPFAYQSKYAVQASRYSKRFNTKNWQCAIVTDVHGDTDSAMRGATIADEFVTIDALVNCGDWCASDYTNLDATKYNAFINKASKPTFTLIGNHDVGNSDVISKCCTNAQAYTSFIKPMVDRGVLRSGEYESGKCYYYHDFTSTKTRLIVLYEYDDDNAVSTTDSTKYKCRRGFRVIRETQANWFVNTLLSTPSGYGVVIALHNPFSKNAVKKECNFTTLDRNASVEIQNFMVNDMIADVVNAFMQKTSYSDTITHNGDAYYIPSYTLTANFANVNSGVYFIGYIGGHSHFEQVWVHPTYTKQMQICPVCNCITQLNTPAVYISMNENDIYSRDCVTTFSGDNDQISMSKVGVDMRTDGTDMRYCSIKKQ